MYKTHRHLNTHVLSNIRYSLMDVCYQLNFNWRSRQVFNNRVLHQEELMRIKWPRCAKNYPGFAWYVYMARRSYDSKLFLLSTHVRGSRHNPPKLAYGGGRNIFIFQSPEPLSRYNTVKSKSTLQLKSPALPWH